MISPLLALLAAQAAAASSSAPSPAAPDSRFQACAQLVRSDPARAAEVAAGWQLEGGGLPARQCLGLAYVAQQRWTEAAGIYEQAARAADLARAPQRANLWVQAGNAWLAAGETAHALTALDAALAAGGLTDELRGEVHLDRGRVMAQTGDLATARLEIDRALQLVPGDPFAWYLSAALARRQDDLGRARTQIRRAVELAPNHPDILLLAGTIAGLAGDMAEAERLYRRVAEIAPGTEAGRSALTSLATVREVEVPAPAAPPAETPQSR